jgi:hypothetical protein
MKTPDVFSCFLFFSNLCFWLYLYWKLIRFNIQLGTLCFSLLFILLSLAFQTTFVNMFFVVFHFCSNWESTEKDKHTKNKKHTKSIWFGVFFICVCLSLFRWLSYFCFLLDQFVWSTKQGQKSTKNKKQKMKKMPKSQDLACFLFLGFCTFLSILTRPKNCKILKFH